MRIEDGKYYRTRDGRRAGPMIWEERGPYFWGVVEGIAKIWGRSGHHGFRHINNIPEYDLISEWTDEGPVRTVTRQEIIPGTYDGVTVGSEVTGHPQREVMVRIATDHGPMVCMDADELERAAAVLTALAGALRDAS